MRRSIVNTAVRRLLSISALIALAACAGEEAGSISDSFRADGSPLASLPRLDWELAPAGCEAQHLSADSYVRSVFYVAEQAPELLAVELDGEIACVDTYPSVEAELMQLGLSDVADSLWLSYVGSLQEDAFGLRQPMPLNEEDPMPSMDGMATRGWDESTPHPETNDSPAEPSSDLEDASELERQQGGELEVATAATPSSVLESTPHPQTNRSGAPSVPQQDQSTPHPETNRGGAPIATLRAIFIDR